jgi:hypothetical protein
MNADDPDENKKGNRCGSKEPSQHAIVRTIQLPVGSKDPHVNSLRMA